MNILEKLGFDSLKFGPLQSVDEMTVIPILGEDLTDKIAVPENVFFAGNVSYGNMKFRNESKDYEGIIPANTMFISEELAQDHALSGMEIVPADTIVSNDFACCIQASQGGLLSKEGDHGANILPLSLRKATLTRSFRQKQSYNKLWKDIEAFLKPIPGIKNYSAHLENFFRPFKQELDVFVAEFEPVPEQLGAAVLFNEGLVGLEVMPTHAHWLYYWEWLIRGCYGAELLRLQKSGGIQPAKLAIPTLPNDVDKALDLYQKYLSKVQKAATTEIDNVKLATQVLMKHNTTLLKNHMITTSYGNIAGGGDIVVDTDKNKPIYASIVV